MERIWIAGNADSGKTALANFIGEKLGIPVYHRDSISWDENDNLRAEEEQIETVKNITKNEKWIFDGARFTASKTDGRLDRCDTIIPLDINRFICVYRGIKRGFQVAKHADIPPAERQPFYFHHITGTLFGYPKKRPQREAIFDLAKEKGIQVIILKRKKDVVRFLTNLDKL